MELSLGLCILNFAVVLDVQTSQATGLPHGQVSSRRVDSPDSFSPARAYFLETSRREVFPRTYQRVGHPVSWVI